MFYSSEKNHPHINHQSSILCKHKPSEQQQETQQQPSSDPTFDHQHHHHHQQQSSNDKTTKHLSSHKTDRISSPKYTPTPTRKAFSIGGLRILQFHSLCGSSLSLCLSLTAMIWQHVTLVVLAAIVTSSMVAIHSNLRHSWIKCLSTPSFWTSKHDYFLRTVAPHREAFQRTSTILLYVNARILGQLVIMTTDINNNNNNDNSSHKELTPRLLVASIIVSWILTTMAWCPHGGSSLQTAADIIGYVQWQHVLLCPSHDGQCRRRLSHDQSTVAGYVVFVCFCGIIFIIFIFIFMFIFMALVATIALCASLGIDHCLFVYPRLSQTHSYSTVVLGDHCRCARNGRGGMYASGKGCTRITSTRTLWVKLYQPNSIC